MKHGQVTSRCHCPECNIARRLYDQMRRERGKTGAPEKVAVLRQAWDDGILAAACERRLLANLDVLLVGIARRLALDEEPTPPATPAPRDYDIRKDLGSWVEYGAIK